MEKRVNGNKNTKYEVWADWAIIFSHNREATIKKTKTNKKKIYIAKSIVSGADFPDVVGAILQYIAINVNVSNYKKLKWTKNTTQSQKFQKITKQIAIVDITYFALKIVPVTRFSSALGINFYYIMTNVNVQNWTKI